MKRIFEASIVTFDDNRLSNFDYIVDPTTFRKTLIKDFNLQKSGSGRVPFMWQVKGNRIDNTISDFVNEYFTDYDFITISSRSATAYDVLRGDLHIYESEEDAIEDQTKGIILVSNFSMYRDPEFFQMMIDIVSGNSNQYYLAKEWKLIFTGNIESGERIWEPSFRNIFHNIELDIHEQKNEDDLDESEDYDDYGDDIEGEYVDDLDDVDDIDDADDLEGEGDVLSTISDAIIAAVVDGNLDEDGVVCADPRKVYTFSGEEARENDENDSWPDEVRDLLFVDAADIIDWETYYETGDVIISDDPESVEKMDELVRSVQETM